MHERYARRARPAIVAALVLLATAAFVLASPAAVQAKIPNPPPGPNEPSLGDPLTSQVTVTLFPQASTAMGAQVSPIDPLAVYPPFPTGPGAPAPASMATAQIELKDSFNTTGLAYCIDLSTETRLGYTYDAGDWAEASAVPNLRYVSYILRWYDPFIAGEPSGFSLSPAAVTAAVQAAIWYFTDNFVLTDLSPLRPATAAIVAAASAGGIDEPDLPEITVTPATGTVPRNGQLVGPFVIKGTNMTTVPPPTTFSAVLDQFGVTTYYDAAGTMPVPPGVPIAISTPSGLPVWVRYDSPSPTSGFRVSAVADHARGSVYMYNGPGGIDAGQKLILATPRAFPVRARVSLTAYDPAAPTIAATGVDSDRAALAGGLLLLIGALLLVGARLRRRAHRP